MYKEFRVIAKRSNGSQVTDNFTALSKQDAIHCFKECYRNDNYEILNVEEI